MPVGKTNIIILVTTGLAVLIGLVMLLVMTGNSPGAEEEIKAVERSQEGGLQWDEKVEVVSGSALRGPWRMNESDWRYVDDASVIVAENGATAIVWGNQQEQDIFLQVFETDGEGRFDEPVNISGSSDIFSWLPEIKTPGDDLDEIYFLWQEIIFSGGSHGGEILFSRSTDGGASFSDPENLSNTTAGAGKGQLTSQRWDNGSLDMAIGPNGEVYAAWTEYEGALRFSRSDDRGESFSNPIKVAGGEEDAPSRAPSLEADDHGAIYLTWSEGSSEGNIHLATSDDRGQTFDDPETIYESDGHTDAPELAVDQEGDLHVAFSESPAGMLERYNVLYTHQDENGGFKTPHKVSDAPSDNAERANYPDIAIDGHANVYLTWDLYPLMEGQPLGLGYAISRDGGNSFTEQAVIPGSANPDYGFNGSLQGMLGRKMHINDSGELALVNSTYHENEASYIWLYRGVAEGLRD